MWNTAGGGGQTSILAIRYSIVPEVLIGCFFCLVQSNSAAREHSADTTDDVVCERDGLPYVEKQQLATMDSWRDFFS